MVIMLCISVRSLYEPYFGPAQCDKERRRDLNLDNQGLKQNNSVESSCTRQERDILKIGDYNVNFS